MLPIKYILKENGFVLLYTTIPMKEHAMYLLK